MTYGNRYDSPLRNEDTMQWLIHLNTEQWCVKVKAPSALKQSAICGKAQANDLCTSTLSMSEIFWLFHIPDERESR
ncbi:hypothetical protein D918_03032 [Trichuris suis]|nr:hypothetical protein D918_03032 [Trichuris suis]